MSKIRFNPELEEKKLQKKTEELLKKERKERKKEKEMFLNEVNQLTKELQVHSKILQILRSLGHVGENSSA